MRKLKTELHGLDFGLVCTNQCAGGEIDVGSEVDITGNDAVTLRLWETCSKTKSINQ